MEWILMTIQPTLNCTFTCRCPSRMFTKMGRPFETQHVIATLKMLKTSVRFNPFMHQTVRNLVFIFICRRKNRIRCSGSVPVNNRSTTKGDAPLDQDLRVALFPGFISVHLSGTYPNLNPSVSQQFPQTMQKGVAFSSIARVVSLATVGWKEVTLSRGILHMLN